LPDRAGAFILGLRVGEPISFVCLLLEVNAVFTSRVLPTSQFPRLETGDHLSRDEFERRYETMHDVKKAELIEGVVFVDGPVRFRAHGAPHADLGGSMGYYTAFTPNVRGGIRASVRLDLKNEFQPDVLFMLDPKCGGQARISVDDLIEGAPELVAEVCSSSVSMELHTKKKVYLRTGVREYLVWRTLDEELDWFVNRGGEFVQLVPDESGIIRSEVFPGLWLDRAALIRDDMPSVIEVLQQGLASPEHAAFVKKQVGSRQ
jgi:Uma2 family endonuclease